ncbi:MAG TPA: pseudouridine synthase [Candidatus Andersenbacteria bacterium]|nr:pseudouridine synthase [Candidatus Andersenbacteria bacterium]
MFVQKYLVEKAICSRKEAEVFLRQGLILVNGKKAQPGVPLNKTDVVTLDPALEQQLQTKQTIAIYKPRGVVCSIGSDTGPTIQTTFPRYKHLNIVGRLDKDSEGLLLLSNDGLITKAVTGDTHQVEKEYIVEVQEKINEQRISQLAKPMKLKVGITKPAIIELLDSHSFRIILQEGKNRQIRRMCGKIHLTVIALKRIRIGNITLGDMRPKETRKLTSEETTTLKNI